MPVLTVSSALPRAELSLAIVEGEGSIGGLIGAQVLPDFPINRRTAHLVKATLADTQALRHIAADKYIHAPGTRFERMVAKLGDDQFTVTLRGVEIVVPNETELDYTDYLDVETFFAARFGREISGLTKEYLIQAAIFNTSTFGAATNSGVAYTAANLTTISFVADIIAATRRIKAKGEPPPYVSVMTGLVMERVRQATTVQQWVVGTFRAGQEATHSMIEQSVREFGIKSILVADSYFNSSADAQTPPVLVPMWSTAYIWTGRPGLQKTVGTPDSDEKNVSEGIGVPMLGGVGVNAYWESYTPGGVPSADKDTEEFAGGNYVESYPDLSIDSTVLRIKMSSLPYIGNPRCGDLIATQYA